MDWSWMVRDLGLMLATQKDALSMVLQKLLQGLVTGHSLLHGRLVA